MANVRKYLQFKDPSGLVTKIRVGEIHITNPSTYEYTITDYGYNTDIIASHNVGYFMDVLSTPNLVEFQSINADLYVDADTKALATRCAIQSQNDTGEILQGAAQFNYIYFAIGYMFCYEPEYNLLIPVSYYGSVRYNQVGNKKIIQELTTLDTPPETTKKVSFGSGEIVTVGRLDRIPRQFFMEICDHIRDGNLDDLGNANNYIYNFFRHNTGNPFEIEYGYPGEPSAPSGGNGEMQDTNDTVLLDPPVPTEVQYMTAVYKVTPQNVIDLKNYLWSTNFLDNIPKLFSDPFSALVSLHAIPYNAETETRNLYIGNLDSGIVTQGLATGTYVYGTVDLGTIDVNEFWQSFLDYQPYTRMHLYLPYIGIVDIPTDLVMGKTIGLQYRIDIMTGACVAVVSNDTNIIATYTGNCATKIPLSNNDHSDIIGNTLVGIAGLTGSIATGNVAGAVANSASIVTGLKEHIQISGSLNTAHGILINSKPFLMIERPESVIPLNYASDVGYTSNITMQLSDTSGFTKISNIKLDGIACTQSEREELYNLMQDGIYL